MRAFIAAAIIVALTGLGWAQQAPIQRYGEKDKEKSFNEKEQEKEAERAYKRSLGNVPEKGPVDPWGNARSAEAPKPAAKAAAVKPKAKTGDAAK
ncbi:MAG TPA: hypothetical protein VGO01_17835 [Bradyrhizobium sp.]|nr:hypothetical protein [Bradyrhizobium sp.]